MGLREDMEAAIEKVRQEKYVRRPMEPLHPDDYKFIQEQLGTTEPLTEDQVLTWAWAKVLEEKP